MSIVPKSQCCIQSIYDFHNRGAERLGAPDSCIVKMLKIEPDDNVIIKIIKLATIFFTAIVNLITTLFDCCCKGNSTQLVVTVISPTGSEMPPLVDVPEEQPWVQPSLTPGSPLASSAVSDDSSAAETETEESETEISLETPESTVASNDAPAKEQEAAELETGILPPAPEAPARELEKAESEVETQTALVVRTAVLKTKMTLPSFTISAPQPILVSNSVPNDLVSPEPEVVELEAMMEELPPVRKAFPLTRTAIRFRAPQPSSVTMREIFQKIEVSLLSATLQRRPTELSLCEVRKNGELIPLSRINTAKVLNPADVGSLGDGLVSSLNSVGTTAARTAAYAASGLYVYSGAVGMYAALTAPVAAVTTLGAVAGIAPLLTSSAFLLGGVEVVRSLYNNEPVLTSLYNGAKAPIALAKRVASLFSGRGAPKQLEKEELLQIKEA